MAQCNLQQRRITTREQTWHLRWLIQRPGRQLCCFGTPGPDQPGIALAIAVVNAMSMQVAMLDAQHLPTSVEHYPRAIVIHNILHDCSTQRAEQVRDVCLRFSGAVRILVVAGTRDPAAWCLNRIRLAPMVCCVATAVKETKHAD
jgi:hypothetical protein